MFQHWLVEGAQSALLIVHGFGEHGGRYSALAEALNQKGINVYTYDQVGHGQATGPRGHINSWLDYREALEASYRSVSQCQPLPLAVMGHSMGSLVVMDWLLNTQLKPQKVILSGTLLETTVGGWKVVAAKALSRFLPKLTMNVGLDADGISSIADEVARYNRDPLVHGVATSRWGAEVLRVMAETNARIDELPPMLIGHGEDDPINPVSGSIRLAKSNKEHQLKTYPGARHEIHYDICAEAWFREISYYLNG